MKNLLLIILFLFQLFETSAAVFNIPNGDVTALTNAIITANNNGQPDTVILAFNGNYNFTTIYTTVSGQPFGYTETEGPVALPLITNENLIGTDIIFNLNGSVLQLSAITKMRLFYSMNEASWELNNGTVKDFESPVNNPIINRGGGGGAIVVGEKDTFKSNGMIFENCKSNSVEERSGAAIYIKGDCIVLLENSLYKNNIGTTYGGAVSILLSDLQMKNCTFENNICTIGGGGAIYIDGCKGPIGASGGLGNIENCVFTNNVSPNFGAVFLQGYFQDQWFVKNCQFTNNKATATGAMGGAIWHNGANNVGISLFDVSNSTFENNEATTHGGAITCGNGSNNFTNCTFFSNKTKTAGGLGGGIYNLEQSGVTHFATINNCTFVDNIAGGYGGAWCISNNQGSVQNTIISNNKAYQQCGYPEPAGCVGYNNANNCAGLLTDNGSNIEFPERPNRISNPNFNDPNDLPCFARTVIVNSNAFPVINPMLNPINQNGGFTKTISLQIGSPAIDMGNNCALLDQRGAARVGICDIGAYEFGATLSLTSEKNDITNLEIYPNPTHGEFTINLPNQYINETFDIAIYTLDGKIILEKKIDKSNNTMKLSNKGIYILKTKINNTIFTNKLIKL